MQLMNCGLYKKGKLQHGGAFLRSSADCEWLILFVLALCLAGSLCRRRYDSAKS